MMILASALQYALDHRTEQLDRLCDWLRIPSISTLPEHAADVKRAAQWAGDYLGWLGMDRVEVVETHGHPIVYSEWKGLPEDAPTLLLYGHYDVQPVDPLEDWQTPPFEPQVVGQDLVGRGTADDKGQFFAVLAALEAYLKTSQKLPVNVKVLLEGEEEVLSPNLSPFLRDNRQLGLGLSKKPRYLQHKPRAAKPSQIMSMTKKFARMDRYSLMLKNTVMVIPRIHNQIPE